MVVPIIWSRVKLSLIGFIGSSRLGNDLQNSIRLAVKIPSRLGLIGSKGFNCPDQLPKMSQLSEIPASSYIPKMNTLGAIPDIPVFEGERVPVSRNALTPGTRPLQLLPLPGSEFPVRQETDAMHGFQTEDDLGKARVGGSSTDASAFWDLLDPLMWSKVVAAGFGDYATGFRRTQPRFPLAMRYALMERWNDYTHSFIFGFEEMTLIPADYTAITGLGFDGAVAPLDALYQTAALGAELVRTLLGVPTRTRYTAQGYVCILGLGHNTLERRFPWPRNKTVRVQARFGTQSGQYHTRARLLQYVSYEVVYRFWAERIRTRLAAWRELPEDVRPAAPAYTREERDQAAQSFIFYLISSQLLCTSQNKGDPAVLGCVRDWAVLAPMTRPLSPWLTSIMVWAYEYRIYPGGPGGDASTDARRIPRYLAHRHHTFSSSEDPHCWRRYLNDRTLADLLLTPWEGDAWEAYPARAVAEAFTRSRILLQGYWRQVPDAPPCHMCMLEGMTPEDLLEEYDGSPVDALLTTGDYALYFTTCLQARLPEDRRRHRNPIYYRAQAEAEAEADAPARPTGAVLGDVPFPPSMEVALDPALGLGSPIIIPADLRQAPPPLQLDPEHATHVPAQRYQELYQRFGFARSYIARLYPELHERDLEIGRLQRHQSRQSSAVTRLQMEADRLRTRLEVEGIPLDFSEDEEDDDDGSSFDDAPPPPPPQAAAGPNRRRR
ncbi:hypothetical protein JCGZ_26562 [Jatropha curcas]|uniref:Aminotransferase-like plant mobile domain-containing protein n=1 Tax=Jatropha curcas TaxID=180498 RepID=A0A067L4R3_JATCU|nr:hypothetical protein JCGZ_26562 [Jatropha curcas]